MSKPKSRILTVIALAVSGVLLAGGLAGATGTPNTYTGCLKGGTITNVKIGTSPTQPCVSPAVRISWNQTGPRGPQGRRGAQGVPGQQGEQGIQGDPGPAGLSAISGQVDPSGSTLAGSGFTVSKDPIEPGQYYIEFPTGTFNREPIATVTAVRGYAVPLVALNFNPSYGSATLVVALYRSPGVAEDRVGFNFIVAES